MKLAADIHLGVECMQNWTQFPQSGTNTFHLASLYVFCLW